jgi:hypothetical protein
MLRIWINGYFINLLIVFWAMFVAWALGLSEGWIVATGIAASIVGWELCLRPLRS